MPFNQFKLKTSKTVYRRPFDEKYCVCISMYCVRSFRFGFVKFLLLRFAILMLFLRYFPWYRRYFMHFRIGINKTLSREWFFERILWKWSSSNPSILDSTSKIIFFEWQKEANRRANDVFLYSIFFNPLWSNWQWLWFKWNSTHSHLYCYQMNILEFQTDANVWQALNHVCVSCICATVVLYHSPQSAVFVICMLRITKKKFQFIHGIVFFLFLFFFHSVRWTMKKSCFA